MRVLSALREGHPRVTLDVCVDARCSQSELFQVAEAGFLRFPASARGDRACITPKGTEKFNSSK